jgi:hypothetical protein
MKLAQNDDGTWAVVDDEGSVLVSGLRTPAPVSRWLDREGLRMADQEDTPRQVQAALADC